MTKRKEQGATLALVISLVFVFLIVGAAFFIWQMLIGGGNELQHATDAGNLNVAKQALLTPDFTLADANDPFTSTNLRKEFGDVLVDNNGVPNYKVNLLNFNRLVGKAVLAQLNAQAEGTQKASDNAIALTKSVYAIGQQLQGQLANAGGLKSQFEGISNQNSVRMLERPDQASTGQSVSQTDAEYAISYMARGKASNVYIDANAFPYDANGNQITLGAHDTVSKTVGTNKAYLVGYAGISTAGKLANCPATWAVPMRPGEQPHLVSIQDFADNEQAPFTNCLPNSFKSGGQTAFARTGTNVALRSTAIIGVLNRDFPVQQSGGVIIVDNMGKNYPSVDLNDPGKNGSIYADPTMMMQPAGMEIFSVSAAGTFPDGTKTHKFMLHADSEGDGRSMLATIEGHAHSTQGGAESFPSGQSPESMAHSFPDNNPLGGTDFWAMLMDNQSRYVSQFPERCQIMGTTGMGAPGTSIGGAATTMAHVAFCNNTSFSGGGGSANPPDCGGDQNTKAFLAYLNGDLGVPAGNTGTTNYTDLMPLEQYILSIQSGSGGGAGCVSVPSLGPVGGCAINSLGSGLKHITTSPGPGAWASGTLDELLGDTNNTGIRQDFAGRLRQIVPGADANSFISSTVVPYNQLLYIYNKNGQLTMDQNAPSSLQYSYSSEPSTTRPVISSPLNVPDGNPVIGTKNLNVSGTFVSGSIWECGSGRASGQSASVSKWYPSSGKAGLLGVLKFNNCPEADGPDWCCP